MTTLGLAEILTIVGIAGLICFGILILVGIVVLIIVLARKKKSSP
jgi:hypothetical protein